MLTNLYVGTKRRHIELYIYVKGDTSLWGKKNWLMEMLKSMIFMSWPLQRIKIPRVFERSKIWVGLGTIQFLCPKFLLNIISLRNYLNIDDLFLA